MTVQRDGFPYLSIHMGGVAIRRETNTPRSHLILIIEIAAACDNDNAVSFVLIFLGHLLSINEPISLFGDNHQQKDSGGTGMGHLVD